MSSTMIDALFEKILKKSLSRREFFKLNAGAALAAAAGGFPAMSPRDASAAAAPNIAVVTGSPGAATRAAVEMLGGMGAFVKKGSKVVIKPNMSFARGLESGTNTHPEVVRELVAMCRQAGASRIRVLDHPLRPNELCIQEVKDACRVFGDDRMVHALEDKEFYREVAIPGARTFKKTDVMRDVLEADVLIAAPVAKSHSSTGVSLSMKGMMGLIYSRDVMHYLHDLNTAIVDLCSFLRPRLVVIDGSRVLSTNGPGGPGKVLRMDTVIASRDMVAADAQAVSMFEWYGRHMEPRQVKHIRIASERGLGRMDLSRLNVGKKSV
ncbi:MAG TPA: DUF362 domain-containing protein [Deltaproteobacteria bacterium]|nr:DUF362 domain-containing protein [Deltaproteobacteria bacterium]